LGGYAYYNNFRTRPNFKPRLYRQLRQPEFPNFTSISVTAAATARCQKLFRAGKGILSGTAPPPGGAFHREIRRVMACSHIDKSRVVVLAKYAGRGFPQLFYHEVVTRRFSRVFAPAILRTGILEVPDIFLLRSPLVSTGITGSFASINAFAFALMISKISASWFSPCHAPAVSLSRSRFSAHGETFLSSISVSNILLSQTLVRRYAPRRLS
jgi:hypothetical protein